MARLTPRALLGLDALGRGLAAAVVVVIARSRVENTGRSLYQCERWIAYLIAAWLVASALQRVRKALRGRPQHDGSEAG